MKTIYGFHAVGSRIRSHPESVRRVYLDEARDDGRARGLLDLANARGVKVTRVPRARLEAMARDRAHQGVAAEVDTVLLARTLDEVMENLSEPPLLLVLDGVTDPHNLGACLRVADGMGAHAVIAPKDRACGINATVEKVACGAAESVPYLMVTNLARAMREIRDAGVWIVGGDDGAAETLFKARLAGPLAIALGAEGAGLRRLTREHCDLLVAIPMSGAVESLNVSVAAGIMLFEARRQRMR